jgi:hypothetical protein
MFLQDRVASGDMNGMKIPEIGKLVAREFKDMSAAQKKVSRDIEVAVPFTDNLSRRMRTSTQQTATATTRSSRPSTVYYRHQRAGLQQPPQLSAPRTQVQGAAVESQYQISRCILTLGFTHGIREAYE